MSPAPLFTQPAPHALESLYAEQGPDGGAIYWILILAVAGAALALPFVCVDVAVSGRAIVTGLAPDGHVLLDVRLREADAQVVATRAPATLAYDALPATEWGHASAEVVGKAGDPDRLTGSVLLHVASPQAVLVNPDGRSAGARVGMAATARIRVGRRSLLRLLFERGGLSAR